MSTSFAQPRATRRRAGPLGERFAALSHATSLGVVSSLFSGLAYGADPPPEEVTVVGARNAAQPTTEVGVSGGQRSLPGSVADLVRGEVGASTQQTTPAQATIYLRGLSGREVVHLVDGIRLNTTVFRAGNNPHLALIEPLSLDRIVLVRGSSAVLRGSDALGGVVSMHTPASAFSDRPTVRTQWLGGASLNPTGAHCSSLVSFTSARVSIDVAAGITAKGDITPGGGERSPDPSSYWRATRTSESGYAPRLIRSQAGTGFSRAWATSAFRAALTDSLDVVLRAQGSVVPDLERYDEIVPRFKRSVPARVSSTTAPFTRLMASASLLSSGATTISWVNGVQRITERVERRNLNETCGSGEAEVAHCTGMISLALAPRRMSEQNATLLLSSRLEVRRGLAPALSGVAGAEIVHERVTSTSSSQVAATGEAREEASRYPDGSTQTQAGVFARASYGFGAVRVTGGARLSTFVLRIADRPDPDPTPGLSSAVADIAPELGVRAQVRQGLALVANAGRGTRAPNVQDFASLGARAGGRFQLPAKSIRPEHITSVDLGLDGRFSRVRFQTFVFGLRYTDAIVLVPTSVGGARENAEGQGYVVSRNASRVDLVGVEAGASGDVVGALTLYGTGLAMVGEQHNPAGVDSPASTPADRVPPVQATLGVRIELSHGWQVETFARGRLAQRRLNDPVNLDDNRIPAGGTDGYVTLHARARWAFAPGWSGVLAADNLLNTLALDHGSGYYLPGFGGSLAVAYRAD